MKTYKEFISEGLLDKMKPKSEEEIVNSLKKELNIDKDYIEVKLIEPKEIKDIKNLIEISDKFNVDIKDYKDDNVLICGNIFNVYNFFQLYLNFKMMNKRNSKIFHQKYIKDNIV